MEPSGARTSHDCCLHPALAPTCALPLSLSLFLGRLRFFLYLRRRAVGVDREPELANRRLRRVPGLVVLDGGVNVKLDVGLHLPLNRGRRIKRPDRG